MTQEKTECIAASAAVLILALAAIAFYFVRDLLAAFAIFSLVFLGLGLALLAVFSAEEVLLWIMRRTEGYFSQFRARHLAPAAHPSQHCHFGKGV